MTDLFGETARTLRGNGYAGSPGKGPQGECCYTCRWFVRRKLSSKTVFKCGHLLGRNTGGEWTDIAAGAPACEHWEGRM